jgi:hypothetical protein
VLLVVVWLLAEMCNNRRELHWRYHALKTAMRQVCSSGCKFTNLFSLPHTIWELCILKHNNFHSKTGDPHMCNPTWEKD